MSEGGTQAESRRRLVLLRHAKSDWPDVADHERPLAKRGRRDAPEAGRWLGESGFAPDAVLCSTARRARETWALAAGPLEAALPPPGTALPPARTALSPPVVRFEPRIYEASVLGLLMLVRELEPRWRTVLFVGHNPGLAELTVGLADPDTESPDGFPTAFAAVLGLSGGWAEAAPGEGRLLAFSVPADRRA
ncbi:MAG TPA: histidine phosphatase family protein [Trebonia sp.]